MSPARGAARLPLVGAVPASRGAPAPPRPLYRPLWGAVLAALLAANAAAQSGAGQPAEAILAPVVVTATRSEASRFDLPAAIDALGQRELRDHWQIGVSETLNRVPGVVVTNRGTFAQEEQIVLRGFGARSQFGVRGVRLLADGIPASMPDGQGGSGLFDLASAGRIEVLRGPFSALYGNHAGGVVQVFTASGERPPSLAADVVAGSWGSWRAASRYSGRWEGFDALVSASRSQTDGYRDWSAARKDQFNAKLRFAPHGATRFTVVLNRLDQPGNLDPLGLTAAEMTADRRRAGAAARTFGTRRSLANSQAGLVVEHELEAGGSLRATLYAGQRENAQYLAFAGAGATSSGGVSSYERDFGGASLRWSGRFDALQLTAGVDAERADDRRQGHVNDFGAQGALRRDEDNATRQSGLYAQAQWTPLPAWSLHAGLRHSRVSFDSRDHHVTGANPDDSGSVAYSAWTPALGVVRHLGEHVNLYASLGRSFETPTFIELAYRPAGASGLNLDLRPSTSVHGEIGVKARLGPVVRFDAALFRIEARDEIVVDTSAGGRTAYRNAGRTRRLGVELSLDARIGEHTSVAVAATWLEARFRDGYAGIAGPVAADNRIPGVPGRTLYAELAWRHPASGFSSAIEGRWSGRVAVDDRNTEAAAGYFVANVRAGFEQRIGTWRLHQFVRLDNAFDRAYVGAVYVNDGNGRYYAPAAPRNWLLGLGATRGF